MNRQTLPIGAIALGFAAIKANEKCVEILMEAGADVNISNTFIYPIVRFAVCRRQEKSLRLFLDARANVNLTCARELLKSVLDIQPRTKCMQFMRLLPRVGIHINKQAPVTFNNQFIENHHKIVDMVIMNPHYYNEDMLLLAAGETSRLTVTARPNLRTGQGSDS